MFSFFSSKLFSALSKNFLRIENGFWFCVTMPYNSLFIPQCMYNIVWSNGNEGQSIHNWWYLVFHDLMHKLTSSLNVYTSVQGFYSFWNSQYMKLFWLVFDLFKLFSSAKLQKNLIYKKNPFLCWFKIFSIWKTFIYE